MGDDDQDFHHLPVMIEEVVELLLPVPAGLYVDATLGGGGHAAALLAARPDLRLLGIDRDPVAVAAAADSYELTTKIPREASPAWSPIQTWRNVSTPVTALIRALSLETAAT